MMDQGRSTTAFVRWFKHFEVRMPAPTPALRSDICELMASWPAVFSILERDHRPLQRPLAISLQVTAHASGDGSLGSYATLTRQTRAHRNPAHLSPSPPCAHGPTVAVMRPRSVHLRQQPHTDPRPLVPKGAKSQDANAGRTSKEAPDVLRRGL